MNYNRFNVRGSVMPLLLIFSMIMMSCGRCKLEEDISRLMNKKITVSYDSLLNCSNEKIVYPDTSQYRYIVYLDSMVCSSCTLKNMYYWEVLQDSIATLGKDVGLVFIYAPSKEEIRRFITDLKHTREEFVSLVDTSGYFIRTNSFIPENSNLHAFLLDRNNKIIMVGNAQTNPEIEKLLFNIIHKSDEI